MDHNGSSSQFDACLDDGAFSTDPARKDSDEPLQPSASTRQSRANRRKSIAEQCQKVQTILTNELHKYPLIRTYLYTLAESDRKVIMEVAFNKTCQSAEPRIAYFLHWFVEEALQTPNQVLNYSLFARRINVGRHVVTKQILPKAIRAYAAMVNEKLFCFLVLTHVPIELPE